MDVATPVQSVTGLALGWKDPWARGREALVLGHYMDGFWLRESERESHLDRYEIQAILVLDELAERVSQE